MIPGEQVPFDGERKRRVRPVRIIDKDPTWVVALNGSEDGEAVVKSLEQRPYSLILIRFQFLQHSKPP